MPSPDNPNQSKSEIGCLGIVETLLLQVLVLVTLSAAVIEVAGELRWSAPVEPWNCALPNENTPPSAATNQ